MGNLISRLVSHWHKQSADWPEPAVQGPYEEYVKYVLLAIDMGDVCALRDLHSEGEDMSWGGLDYISVTPSLMHHAAAKGFDDVMRLLIEFGVSVDETDTCGMTPLHEACKRRWIKTVEELVPRVRDIDKRDVWGRTPLIKALVYRNVEAAKLLLERGANPNAIDTYGITPLSTAIDYNLVDMLRVLVQHGADVNLITQHMYKCSGPPLYQAANNQNMALVCELLRLGATTQPRAQHYGSCYNSPGSNTPYFITNLTPSFPTLQHSNAVTMAISEILKRGPSSLDISSPCMEILMILLAAHGHPLGSCTDVLVRVLINSQADMDFSLLLRKLQVCSSSSEDMGVAANRDSHPSQRGILQRLDQHLRGGSGNRQPPRAVMSLQNQARRVVRSAVMASGRSVIWAIKRIECPPALKSLLILKDIDRAYSSSLLNKPLLDHSS